MAMFLDSTRSPIVQPEDRITPVPPAPLPSLTSALNRRRALFGAVALAAAPVAALPAIAAPVPADPLLDVLLRSNALIAYGHTISADDPNADEPMNQADDLLREAFDLRATTPAGALASLQWARDGFARYYVTEKEDDDPDWMDRLTLNMLDSALGILRPLVEGGHHA